MDNKNEEDKNIVYFYLEGNDVEPLSSCKIKIFSKYEKGIEFLRKRVNEITGYSIEELKESDHSSLDILENDNVIISSCGNTFYFMLSEKKVE